MGFAKRVKKNAGRRKFGKAGGMHNKQVRDNQKAFLLKREERIRLYKMDKSHYSPYQLVRKISKRSDGIITKFIVKRIPIYRDQHSKLLRLGKTSLKFKYMQDTQPVLGYRIVNIQMLQKHLLEITAHSCLCVKAQAVVESGKDPIKLKTEISRTGLFSILMAVCQGCNKEFSLQTSTKQSNGLYDINVRAVWGSVSSGSGCSDLNEILGAMNVPPMHETMFTRLEEKIGSWWEVALKDEMIKAGAEEKRIAVENGHFHDGVPEIAVICDGGWSKRTHKHSYNAHGGVGVIFGAVTKKLLYIGVRNKYCSICQRAENQHEHPKDHNCFKNWSQSSQAMESDIILSGFLEAESVHGVRYTKLIADGDSSVYTLLQEKVPVWGVAIEKLECANHTCKCIRSNLEKLVVEKPEYKGKGKLSKVNRVRLTTAIRCAIRMRSEDKNVKLLKHDITNSVYHILGFHDRCSNFCRKKKIKIEDTEEAENNDNSFDAIFDDQYEFWKIPSEKEMEQSRSACKSSVNMSDLKELIHDVQIILNRVAEKSHRLIGNFTTNLAESWMAIRAKFDGGKVVNRCGRGSWHTRCYGGALRKNIGASWSPLTFQNVTGTQAGTFFIQNARRQEQKLTASKKYKAKPESKTIQRKRKLCELQQSQSKKAKYHYGSNMDDSPDVTHEKLQQLCDTFMNHNVVKTEAEIKVIEKTSIDQVNSEIWKKERHIRLTSSNFGKVMSRRPNNVSTPVVKNMLYNKFKGNMHTVRGLAQEANTIIEYKNMKPNVEVERVGLRICSEHNFLAASTDGLVTENGEEGLLEIKNFLQTNKYMLKQAVKKVPNFCLEEIENSIKLKKHHEIYYQIQGQMNIFDKDWCDVVIRRTNPHDMHVERIKRDTQLWEKDMLPKLKQFYFKFILPELALPRYGTYSGIREPKAPWFDPNCNTVSTSKALVQQKRQRRATVKHISEEKQQTSTDNGVTDCLVTSNQPSTSGCEKFHPNYKTVSTLKALVQQKRQRRTTVKHISEEKQQTSTDNGVTDCLVTSNQPSTSGSEKSSSGRSRRQKYVKFVGREILHQWVVNEKTGKTKWFAGTVLEVITGKDGDPHAVYEVLYKEEDSVKVVPELALDFQKGHVKFIDV